MLNFYVIAKQRERKNQSKSKNISINIELRFTEILTINYVVVVINGRQFLHMHKMNISKNFTIKYLVVHTVERSRFD